MAALENFRINLKTVIEKNGLKKSHIATKLHTSRSYIDEVIKGETEPKLSSCENLAHAVGLPLEALLVAPEVFEVSLLTSVR